MTTVWIKCDSVLLTVALWMETTDYKSTKIFSCVQSLRSLKETCFPPKQFKLKKHKYFGVKI